MTCAHPPGRVACERCHEFRAVRVCPVCCRPESNHARMQAADGTVYIGCPALTDRGTAYVWSGAYAKPPDDKR